MVQTSLNILNVYLYGSRVYNTHNEHSDFDLLIVVDNEIEEKQIRKNLLNITIISKTKFIDDVYNDMVKLECLFSPISRETLKINFVMDKQKLRKLISSTSSNSWIKSKKKLMQNDYYVGIKSMFHSLRILIFGIQLMETNAIYDFTQANYIWDELKSKQWNWDELNDTYRKRRNELATKFKLLTKNKI